ncbi:25S rRNA (adenine645-N1)-methyltransferase [Tilletia horrida]|nr:25S rRNA (adenine645-N1)-methyltransferase [Tilletia horrida]
MAPPKDKAAAEIDAIQAQLERTQASLADTILAKLGSVGASSSKTTTTAANKTSSNAKGKGKGEKNDKQRDKLLLSAAPRSSTLGLGAVPAAQTAAAGSSSSGPKAALNEADVRLRGRLVSKRKRGEHDAEDDAGDVSSKTNGKARHIGKGSEDKDDDEDEAGRSKVVSQSSSSKKAGAGPSNDIFAQAAKKQKKATAAAAAAAAAPAESDEMAGLSKAQRKKMRKKAKLEAEAQGGTEDGDVTMTAADASVSSSVKSNGAVAKAASTLSPSARTAAAVVAPAAAATSTAALTPLQKAMSQKLAGARFRTINETLYTQSSRAAVELMEREPGTLAEYHSGFREQVKGWPKNPVDVLARRIASASTASTSPTPLIADLGAGEAPLQQALRKLLPAAKVLSYDLLTSPDGRIVGADCARFPFGVPLPGDPRASSVPACVRRALDEKTRAKASAKAKANGKEKEKGKMEAGEGDEGDAAANPQAVVDVVVFCLSLMPTNWVDMILEARRILREGGELYIAEVASRFNTLDTFISILERSGFKLLDKDDSNTHFTLLHLRMMKDAVVLNQWKADHKGAGVAEQGWEEALAQAEADEEAYRTALVEQGATILKPCLYKRR